MNYLFLGDVHGKFDLMEKLIGKLLDDYNIDRIVQVGDFGFYPGDDPLPTQDFGVDQWFIRGNHENHDAILALEGEGPIEIDGTPWRYVSDGYVDENGCLYIGGAYSIDKKWRLMMETQYGHEQKPFPYKWYPNEEIEDWSSILNDTPWEDVRMVATHDCPKRILSLMHAEVLHNKTSRMLDEVADKTVGDINWFFGHHHKNEYIRMLGRINMRCIDMFAGNGHPYYIFHQEAE